LLTTKFKQSDLGGECSGEGLSVSDKPSGSQGKIVSNFEQLLHAFVCDEVPHCGSMICSNNYTSFESDS
jgi:hypothetical protein